MTAAAATPAMIDQPAAATIRRGRRRYSASGTAPVPLANIVLRHRTGTNRASAFPRLQPLAMRLALSFDGKSKCFGYGSLPSSGSTTGLSAIGALVTKSPTILPICAFAAALASRLFSAFPAGGRRQRRNH